MKQEEKNDSPIVVRIRPEIAKLIPRFIEARHRDLDTLTEALEAGDFDSIRRMGHNMKGVGAAYGFAGLSEIGASIEAAARQGQAKELRSIRRSLASYLKRLRVEAGTGCGG